MGNLLPIGWRDLQAFSCMGSLNLKPFETDLIMRLDAIYRRVRAEIERE